jgi:hypothetical protein
MTKVACGDAYVCNPINHVVYKKIRQSYVQKTTAKSEKRSRKNRFVYIFALEAFSFHITKDLYSRKDMNLARFNIDFM